MGAPGGAPLELWLLEPHGGARSVLLGPGSDDTHVGARAATSPMTNSATSPVARVPAHAWQAARVAAAPTAPPGLEWSLVTCVVTPGFEYTDFELGRRDVLSAGWPEVAAIVGELT